MPVWQKVEGNFFSTGLNSGGGETPSKESPLEDSSTLPFPKKKKRTPIQKTPPLLENGHGSEAGDIAVETAEQGARREAAKKSSTPVKIRSFKSNVIRYQLWLTYGLGTVICRNLYRGGSGMGLFLISKILPQNSKDAS
jgi:hypothetical protein